MLSEALFERLALPTVRKMRRFLSNFADSGLHRSFPEYNSYEIPICLSSDWLNEYLDIRFPDRLDGDYKFLYLGPKGSW